MKSIPRKIVACLMTVLMVLATLSFNAALHFCGDHLVDISFDGSTDSCGMMPLDDDGAEACDLMGIDCCTDIEIAQNGQQTTDAKSIDVNVDTFPFQAAPLVNAPQRIEITSGLHFPPHQDPERIRDLTVWNQVFLL